MMLLFLNMSSHGVLSQMFSSEDCCAAAAEITLLVPPIHLTAKRMLIECSPMGITGLTQSHQTVLLS